MIFNQWATRWGIDDQAIDELIELFGLNFIRNDHPEPISEAAVQQQVRLKASKQGSLLWRNNVGVLMDDRGVPVRFGLCNDSKQLNDRVKSSDLIGITPVTITGSMVGSTVGVFTAYEVKAENWKYHATHREQAQLRFIELVASKGGIAKFINNAGDL